jgi:hypothetical protein
MVIPSNRKPVWNVMAESIAESKIAQTLSFSAMPRLLRHPWTPQQVRGGAVYK